MVAIAAAGSMDPETAPLPSDDACHIPVSTADLVRWVHFGARCHQPIANIITLSERPRRKPYAATRVKGDKAERRRLKRYGKP